MLENFFVLAPIGGALVGMFILAFGLTMCIPKCRKQFLEEWYGS